MATKLTWHQEDLDTAPARTLRELHKAQSALEVAGDLVDNQLNPLRAEGGPTMFTRALTQFETTLSAMETLTKAYEYYLVRCLEAGLSPAAAATAWNIHSSEAFEDELIEAERHGPNAMQMIDISILRILGIPPHDQEPGDAPCGEGAPGE